MNALTAGNLEAEVPLDGHDEITTMAEAVRVFKDNTIEMKRLGQEQIESEKRNREERQEAMRSMADDFESQVKAVVDTLSASAGQMESTAKSMSGIAEESQQKSIAVASATEEASMNVQTVATSAEELSSSIAEIGRQMNISTRIASHTTWTNSSTNELHSGTSSGWVPHGKRSR